MENEKIVMTEQFRNEIKVFFSNPDTFNLGVNLICKEYRITIMAQLQDKNIKIVLLLADNLELFVFYNIIRELNCFPGLTVYNVDNRKIEINYKW